MIDKPVREFVNLLIYGGFFIGLCASCITALTFEINAHSAAYLDYSIWIGIATAALYCGHRVIGLRKLDHIQTYDRFTIIRKYERHIWFYFILWCILCAAYFFLEEKLSLFFWLLPGGVIGLGYILPFISGGKRLRDFGWVKIIMIGWSWGWLTAFIPMWYIAGEPIMLSVIHGVERMLFIILITIPFEIRDLRVDLSVGLSTLPAKLGNRGTRILAGLLVLMIILTAAWTSFHYLNPSYVLSMSGIAILSYLIVRISPRMKDDYFFGGVTDGLMILALSLFCVFDSFL